MCEETLRLQHSDRRVEICQSAGFSPSSFGEIRGLCNLNTVYRMGLRTRMRQTTGLSLPSRLLAQSGLKRDCFYTQEADYSCFLKFCLKGDLDYMTHSYTRDRSLRKKKQKNCLTHSLVDYVGNCATLRGSY